MKKSQVIKQCKICGMHKVLNEFTIHRNYADKHSNICLECNRNKRKGFITEVIERLERIEKKLN